MPDSRDCNEGIKLKDEKMKLKQERMKLEDARLKANQNNNRFKNKYLKGLTKLLIACILLILNSGDINAAVEGEGTSSKPYIVDSFDELEYTLTSGKRSNGDTYIEVIGTVKIKKSINVEGGTFHVYAGSEGALLTKSNNEKDNINDKSDPKYCFKIGKQANTKMYIGCAGNNVIKLGGNRSYYETNGIVSSGWLYIGDYAEVELGYNAKAQNMINNDPASGLSNFSVYGLLKINCVIENCSSINGGAVCVKNVGRLEILENAHIYKCKATTEGGAIWVTDHGKLSMYGGVISGNESSEEGGGIFIGGINAYGEILGGVICNNKSGGSAGGVFSGYGATLVVGKEGTNGPVISENHAEGSGGGIRPNGGIGEGAGGRFYFYSGRILNNVSEKYGGGIGVGTPGNGMPGVVYVINAHIVGNKAKDSGGGMFLSDKNTYENKSVEINNSLIIDNVAEKNGGGIVINAPVLMKNNEISNNSATNGGGLYIGQNSKVISYSGEIKNNKASNLGKGIYLKGAFCTGESFRSAPSDEIYLCRNTYIEVDRTFVYDVGHYFTVDSQDKANGTKLVYVSYANGASEKLLYGNDYGEEEEYKNTSIHKNINHINLGVENNEGYKIIRSAGGIPHMDSDWIIISARYEITYDKNTKDWVDEMPDNHIKFYDEPTKLSENIPVREEYEFIINSSWNSSKDGNGQVCHPGDEFLENKSITLYAIWKKVFNIMINAGDRYYIKGQDVELNEQEILKKISVTDNMNTGWSYEIRITEVKEISKEASKKEKVLYKNNTGLTNGDLSSYINTGTEAVYELKLYTSNNEMKKSTDKTMRVHICEVVHNISRTRFISKQYLFTLSGRSVWQEMKHKKILEEAVGKQVKYKWTFDSEAIKKIKLYNKNNKYSENGEVNASFYNKYMVRRKKT